MEKLQGLGSPLTVGRGITRRDSWAIDFIEENWVRLETFTAEQLVKIEKTELSTTINLVAEPVGVTLMASNSERCGERQSLFCLEHSATCVGILREQSGGLDFQSVKSGFYLFPDFVAADQHLRWDLQFVVKLSDHFDGVRALSGKHFGDPVRVIDLYDETVLVFSNVEAHAVVFEDARVGAPIAAVTFRVSTRRGTSRTRVYGD